MSNQNFQGLIVANGQYKVGAMINEGSQGQVYEVKDLTQCGESHQLIIKISNKLDDMDQEIKTLWRLNEKRTKAKDYFGIPPLINHGKEEHNGETLAYFVTARYQISLEDYLDAQSGLHGSQCFEIICQLVDIMKDVHGAKYSYNDLKPDNIMLTSTDNGEVRVSLVDFGYAKRYKNGSKHVDQRTLLDNFQGNMLFGSVNQLNFHATSRKDDLYSVMYLLIFLLNDNELPELQKFLDAKNVDPADQANLYRGIKQYKELYTLSNMLNRTKFDQNNKENDTIIRGKVQKLVSYVEGLKFEDRPDYEAMKTIITKCQNLTMC